MFDAIRGYLQLASGLAELSRARALEAAGAVLSLPTSMTSTSMGAQVTALADEILAAATANRASLLAIVRSEVENAVERAGLVSAADLDRARAALLRLSADLEDLRAQILGSSAVRSVTGSGVSAIGALSGQHTGEGSRGPGSERLSVAGSSSQGAETSSALNTRSDDSTTTKALMSTTGKGTTPAKKGAVATKGSPAKKGAVATKRSPAKRGAAATTSTAPAKRTSQAKKGAAATKGSPANRASAAPKTTPAKRTSAAKTTSSAGATAGKK